MFLGKVFVPMCPRSLSIGTVGVLKGSILKALAVLPTWLTGRWTGLSALGVAAGVALVVLCAATAPWLRRNLNPSAPFDRGRRQRAR